jgi:hypothetical protein
MTAIDKFIRDSEVHKKSVGYKFLHRLQKDRRYRKKHDLKKMKMFFKSNSRIVISNKAGWKVRVPIIKAFFVGTNYRMKLTIRGEEKYYNSQYFTFDIRRLYRRMMKDDVLFDEVMQMFYFLRNNLAYYLRDSRLLTFLTKLEKAMYRHKFGGDDKK